MVLILTREAYCRFLADDSQESTRSAKIQQLNTEKQPKRKNKVKKQSPRKYMSMETFEEKVHAELERQRLEAEFQLEKMALKEARAKLQREKEQLKQRMFFEEEQTKILMHKMGAHQQGNDSDVIIQATKEPTENENMLERFQDMLSKLPNDSREKIADILKTAEISANNFPDTEMTPGSARKRSIRDTSDLMSLEEVNMAVRRPQSPRPDFSALCDLLDQHFLTIFEESNDLPNEIQNIKLNKDSWKIDRPHFAEALEKDSIRVTELQKAVFDFLNKKAEKELASLFDMLDLDTSCEIGFDVLRTQLFPSDFEKRFTHIDINRERKVDLVELRFALQFTNGTYDLQRIYELKETITKMKINQNHDERISPNANVKGFAMVAMPTISLQMEAKMDPGIVIRDALLRGGIGGNCEPQLCQELIELCDLLDTHYEFLFQDDEEWNSFPLKARETFLEQQKSDIHKVDRNLLFKAFNNNIGTVLGIKKCIESILKSKFEADFKDLCEMLAVDPNMKCALKNCSWIFDEDVGKVLENFTNSEENKEALKMFFVFSDGTFDLQRIREMYHLLETRPLESPEISEEIPRLRVQFLDVSEESPAQKTHLESMAELLGAYGMLHTIQHQEADNNKHFIELCELLDTHYDFLFVDDYNHTSFYLLPDEIKPIFELIQIPLEGKVNRKILAENLQNDPKMTEEIRSRIQTVVIQHFDEQFRKLCDTIDFDLQSDGRVNSQEFEWIFANQQAREFFNNFNMVGSNTIPRAAFRDLFALPDGTFDIVRLTKISELVAKKQKLIPEKIEKCVSKIELRDFLTLSGLGVEDLGPDFSDMCALMDEHFEYLFVDGNSRLWNTFSVELKDVFQNFCKTDVRKIDRNSLGRAISKDISQVQSVTKRIEAFVLRKFNEQFDDLCELVDLNYNLQVNLDKFRWMLPNQSGASFFQVDKRGAHTIDRIEFRAMFKLEDGTYDIQRLREMREMIQDNIGDREERTRNYHDEIKLAYQRHVVEEKMSNSSEGRPRITRGECKGTGEYVILFFKRVLQEMEKLSRQDTENVNKKYEVSRHIRNMRPLIRCLEKNLCDEEIVTNFGRLVDCCLEKEYQNANQLQLKLANEHEVWSEQGLSKSFQRNCIKAIEEIVQFCHSDNSQISLEIQSEDGSLSDLNPYRTSLATFSD